MPRYSPSALKRYAVAVAVSLLALTLRLFFPLEIRFQFTFFYPAIMLSAWYGGLGSGLISTALCAFGASLFVLPSFRGQETPSSMDVVGLGLFFLVGAVISVLNESLHQSARREQEAREAAESARADAEQIQKRCIGFLESMGDAFTAVDRDLRITYMNRKAEEILGRSREELLGKTLEEGFPESLNAEFSPALRNAVAQGLEGHVRAYQPPPSNRWFEADFYAVPDGVSVFWRDVSERIRAEDEKTRLTGQIDAERGRLMAVVASVPGIVWEAWGSPEDPQARMGFISDYAEAMLGYRMEEWLSSPRFWLTIAHPEDRARAEHEAAAIFASGKGGTSEFRWVRRDGQVLWVESQSIVISDEAGRPLGMRGVVIDITERKKLEQERLGLLNREREARSEAQTANRMKDEFLATVSHELRTPLTAVLGWARLLRTETIEGETSHRALETIERNAKSLAQLVDDLLDVSRIITGKLRLEVQAVFPQAVIEGAIEAVRPAAEAKGIRLQTTLDSNTGPVSGDPDRLQQVVWNLLSNAIKFTPRGGRVQTRLTRAGSEVEICVSDTGEGIDPEVLPYVFDRFRQADGTSTRKQRGIGLGLAIVRHLVELHGGAVTAASGGAGCGASFTVRLPCMIVQQAGELSRGGKEREGAPSTAVSTRHARRNGLPSLVGVRVLVVEDEPDARDLLSHILMLQGAQVETAASAADAFLVMDKWKPDVLVSDIEMPGEDGYSLIRKIRDRESREGGRLPAAALTAYARAEDRTRALLAGFQTHLAKPVTPSEVVAAVASLAGRHGA